MVTEIFSILGRIVTHESSPRVTILFKPAADGAGWEGAPIEWLDPPPRDAAAAARLMRQAGDFFAANVRRDWIQELVVSRAAALKLSSYKISKRTGNAVSEDHVRAYITREKSMGSHKLQHVLRVLGLKIIQAD